MTGSGQNREVSVSCELIFRIKLEIRVDWNYKLFEFIICS